MPSDAATTDSVPDPDATAAPDPQATTDQPGSRDGLGTVIAGKYKLTEPLGEGGMGTVYLARQSEPVRRFVAVKLIKAGLDSKAVLARFEAERQALAMLGWSIIASACRSASNRASTAFESSPALMSFTATNRRTGSDCRAR